MAGALLEAEWRWVLAHTGFSNVEWGREIDVFSGSRHESDAAEFGTHGVTFAAIRSPSEAEKPEVTVAKKVIRCYCGFVAEGDDGQLVVAVQGHVREVHQMEYTREQVLAMAEPLE